MTSHAPKILMAALLLAAADVQAAASAPPPAATSSASADAPWLVAVGPRLGINLPTSKLHAFIVAGLSVDVALPVLEHRLSVATSFASATTS